MPEKASGEIPIQVINKLDKNLHSSPLANQVIKMAQLDGNVIDQTSKQDRLQALLGDELHGGSPDSSPDLSLYAKIFNNPNEEDRLKRLTKYKEELLYPDLLIDKNNVPDSYFALQLKIARERGQAGDLGNIKNVSDIDQSTRLAAGETIYQDQKKSLDNWVDYLSSPDAPYPTWFKYYTLTSVSKMGVYDKAKHEFSKRTKKDTTTIFPDLNREALSYTYDVLEKHYLKHQQLDNDELTKILDTANFSKIYSFAIDKATPASKENKEKIEGQWTKFNQGDDATALYESLQGHGTGWCIAGKETARRYLKRGDFYVYYSKDEKNQNTIPRIAIRMEGGKVAEVRGIAPHQNMEDNMLDIAKEKYHQLPGGKEFDKKDADMKLLTLIDNKTKNNQELTKDELKFLYEISSRIEGFGQDNDPRIEEIRGKRNIIFDLNRFLEGIDVYNGDLSLRSLTSAEGLILPDTING
ncbi:MAG: hypothetical protein EOM67_14250, partial [Spirochaetia bacterium]|nr:hypothetical protein [Spirochaetia bacterium]